MEGIIVLDKPQDFTSFDAVAVVRGLTRERRIGHTGTLDPMATGVLPLLLGRATKAVSLLPETAKTYEASFRFGEAYTTGDVTGEVIKTDETPVLRAALETALDSFRGDILQVPPMYSAVSVNGQRLYKLARQGIEIEREARPVHIAELTLLEYNENEKTGKLHVTCSKGTYIRTLIEDIAQKCGTVGAMTALRRTAACGFTLADAVSLDTLKAMKENGESFDEILRPVEKLFSMLTAVSVTPAQAQRYLNGGALTISRCRAPKIAMPEGTQVALYEDGEKFLGLARAENGEFKYVKSFSKKLEGIGTCTSFAIRKKYESSSARKKRRSRLARLTACISGIIRSFARRWKAGSHPLFSRFGITLRSTLQAPAAISPPLRSACAF